MGYYTGSRFRRKFDGVVFRSSRNHRGRLRASKVSMTQGSGPSLVLIGVLGRSPTSSSHASTRAAQVGRETGIILHHDRLRRLLRLHRDGVHLARHRRFLFPAPRLARDHQLAVARCRRHTWAAGVRPGMLTTGLEKAPGFGIHRTVLAGVMAVDRARQIPSSESRAARGTPGRSTYLMPRAAVNALSCWRQRGESVECVVGRLGRYTRRAAPRRLALAAHDGRRSPAPFEQIRYRSPGSRAAGG